MSTTTHTPRAARERRSDTTRDNDDGTAMLLPEGAVPCRSCGAAVAHPDPKRADVLRLPQANVLPVIGKAYGQPSLTVPLTTCDKCAERRDRAAALLAEHPRVRLAHGMVGLDRLDAALGHSTRSDGEGGGRPGRSGR
ncbi:MAG TPA: hypothetical protein VL043_06205 [Protaetiibacter sp.]|nr:hypothetical protein [Protaetiibacter sp.]